MGARLTSRFRIAARTRAAVVAACCSLAALAAVWPAAAQAQTEVSDASALTSQLKEQLVKRGNLTLRDANFVEALFVIRRTWGVNIVAGNELKGETLSCEFVNAPLHEILDAVLAPRGYGYQPLGGSLVIVKLEELGDLKPLFESAIIPVLHAEPNEVLAAVQFYLSRNGRIQAVPSSKSLVMVDFADRIAVVRQKAAQLDEAAKTIRDQEQRRQQEEQRPAAGASDPFLSGGQSLPQPPTGANTPLKAAYFKPQFTKVEALQEPLQQLLSSDGKIAAIPRENRLVVIDWEQRLQLIAEAVQRLDIPRPQVRIAALIYDASLEDLRRCGVNWRSSIKSLNMNNADIAQDQAVLDTVTAVAVPSGAPNGALTLMTLGSSLDLTTVVQALAECKDSRLLADPNVTVVDQEQARIEIVKEIPYQQLTQGINGGQIGTTAFREAGITLNVTPQISQDNTVALVVNPRFSVLAGFTPQTNQPIIDRRETQTTVRVGNRQTLVIGGLRQRSSNENHGGIPYLKDMRWGFGKLFRSTDDNHRESELVVFLTPEVLSTDYLGRPREHQILNGGSAELEQVATPRYPIPTSCGNPCTDPNCPKHGRNCQHCQPGQSYVIENPPGAPYPAYGHPGPPLNEPVRPLPPVEAAPLPPQMPSPPQSPSPPLPPQTSVFRRPQWVPFTPVVEPSAAAAQAKTVPSAPASGGPAARTASKPAAYLLPKGVTR